MAHIIDERNSPAADESPTTNTPEKFAHLDTKQEGEPQAPAGEFQRFFFREVKEIQQLVAREKRGKTGLANFRPISHSVWC
jgi:hypothetical protein